MCEAGRDAHADEEVPSPPDDTRAKAGGGVCGFAVGLPHVLLDADTSADNNNHARSDGPALHIDERERWELGEGEQCLEAVWSRGRGEWLEGFWGKTVC